MMLVKILGFGSNWWARFGDNQNDPWRFSRHAAYYNSAGLRCGRKIRRHWLIAGLIRFNGVGAFNPYFPNRSIGKTFCCHEPVFSTDGNRLLLEEVTEKTPDYFLVAIASDRHGVVDFRNPRSKSEMALPIAVSELRDRQEAILLMKPAAWVVSSVGFWELVIGLESTKGVSLRLAESLAPVVV